MSPFAAASSNWSQPKWRLPKPGSQKHRCSSLPQVHQQHPELSLGSWERRHKMEQAPWQDKPGYGTIGLGIYILLLIHHCVCHVHVLIRACCSNLHTTTAQTGSPPASLGSTGAKHMSPTWAGTNGRTSFLKYIYNWFNYKTYVYIYISIHIYITNLVFFVFLSRFLPQGGDTP